uniref:Microfibril associated protein 5 n=1 Tax=Cyprinus carpio carpio TaxID=630221 RepID=A0A9J7XAM5_CYPCA
MILFECPANKTFLLFFLTVLVTVQAQQTEIHDTDATALPPPDCREETYPCTRMYSVHRPIKRCIHSLCLYSLPRVYVINKEICVRTVCQQDEILMGETLNISVTNYRTCDSVGGTLVFFFF